jgi:CRP-like cAMP-binding protein
MRIRCHDCPLRKLEGFQTFTATDVKITDALKHGELRVDAGMPILEEGSSSPQLYTVLQGQGVRFKTLESGRRQVLSFVFPGDFLGLQAAVMEEMDHSVESTTEMVLCVFDRKDLRRLYREAPERAFDITWAAAEEETLLSEALTAVGQRTAKERVAWGLLRLMQRAQASGLARGNRAPMPFRQHDFADAMGLSLVHTNKTLSAIRREALATWAEGWLEIHDPDALAALAGTPPQDNHCRPLI